MENKRMTWEEIVEKYPDQWVGLVDVDGNGPNVRSAVVKCTAKDGNGMLEYQIKDHSIYGKYTTPENLIWLTPSDETTPLDAKGRLA